MSAALHLGIREDFGLAVAGVVGTIMILIHNRGKSSAARESASLNKPEVE